ncbi:MAG: hypothetical protein V3573_12750 [Desulfovibrionaceae bacterium]
MPLIFGAPKKTTRLQDDRQDPRAAAARAHYLAGRIKIVTTDEMPNRQVQGTFGVIVCRSYVSDNAFYGLIAQAIDVNADAVVGYRESVAFHPDGEKYYSCYGTAIRLKPEK